MPAKLEDHSTDNFAFDTLKKISKILSLFLGLFLSATSIAQVQVSVGTDIGAARSFKQGQKFTVVGHDINFQFHLTPKNSIIAWLVYTIPGKFEQNLVAVAKSPGTTPAEISFLNKSQMNFAEISVGWKRYLKGDYAAEEGWNLYSIAGLGLITGNASNSFVVDTVAYSVPVRRGKGDFKRMTLDLGVGVEFPAGGDVFLYGEAKTFVPLTNYPNPYLFNNDYSPLVGFLSFGIRLLFN